MQILPQPSSYFNNVSGSLSTCYDEVADAPNIDLGTRPYTIIMWAPSLTSLYGPGGAGALATSSKLGGFFITQGSNGPQNVAIHLFTRAGEGLTMQDLYKDDLSSFAQRGMVWASEIDLKIALPEANWAGTIYKGQIPMAELNGKSNIPLAALIAIAGKGDSLKNNVNHTFSLKGAIVNHQLACSEDTSSTPIASDQVPDLFK